MSLEDREGIVAQVYFATNESNLDANDRSALVGVYNRYAAFLFKQQLRRDPPKVHLRFVGYADYRGTESHNLGLSQRRAKVVADYFQALRGSANYSQSVVAMGEAEHPQETSPNNGPISRQLNPFRRVDMFARPILAKRLPPPAVEPPKDLVSEEWALRIVGSIGYTKELEVLLKKVPSSAAKELAKRIPKLGVGYNVMLVEIIDLQNRLAMIYTIEGLSLAVGIDLNFSIDPSEWLTVKTTKPIHIQNFEGHARHTGGAAQILYGYAFDYLQFFGPMQEGAESVYVKFGGWGRGKAVALDTEIRASVTKQVDPYPIPPDYIEERKE